MIDEPEMKALDEARRILRGARKVMVITGAGMSAECGLATFRDGADGRLWNRLAEELATPQGFSRDPHRVWDWYAQRRREALRAMPHAGYTALVEWERRAEVGIVTQNVDGLHARAGGRTVVELHGSLHRFMCAAERHPVEGVAESVEVPACPRCGSPVRPAVVWFGEAIPEEAVWASAEAWNGAQALLVVGTSLAVSTPQAFIRSAERRGVPIVEVNPEPALTSAAAVLAAPAGSALPLLLAP
jgi:NAD-dependent deacetylase